jgi:hypothetical protein
METSTFTFTFENTIRWGIQEVEVYTKTIDEALVTLLFITYYKWAQFEMELSLEDKQALETKGEFTLEDIQAYPYRITDANEGYCDFELVGSIPENVQQRIEEFLSEHEIHELIEMEGWEDSTEEQYRYKITNGALKFTE